MWVAALVAAASMQAQTLEKTTGGIKFSTAQPVLNGEVTFYSPSIVRVVKYPSAEMPPKKSYPVILMPGGVDITYRETGDEVVMQSACMSVILNVRTGQVTYCDLKGNRLLAEKPYGTNFLPRKDVEKDSYTVSQTFMLHPDEVIYGLGQRQTGVMNHRNQQIELRNVNTNICIPYFTSEKGMAYTGITPDCRSLTTRLTRLRSLPRWDYARITISSTATAAWTGSFPRFAT